MKLLHLQSTTEITVVYTLTTLPSSSCTSPAAFHLLCCHEEIRTRAQTTHGHHAFISYWSSKLSNCVQLPQHSKNATWSPRSCCLVDIRNAASSRNSSPPLLRRYTKLSKSASPPWSCQLALASFSQPSLFLQQSHLGEVHYRPMTRPTSQIPHHICFLSRDGKETCICFS